jgi:hypothetical protein
MRLQLAARPALSPERGDVSMSNECGCRILLNLLTLGVIRNLPLGEIEKTAYVEKMNDVVEAAHRKYIFEHFYRNLDVLDRKTNAMFAFTSILVVVYVALVEYRFHNRVAVLGSTIGALCAFFAAIMFLFVETVHWSSPLDVSDPQRHANILLNIRDRRTIWYRVGWIFSFVSLVILFYTVVVTGGFPIKP